MGNYYSKFGIESIDANKVKVDKNLYRKYGLILTSVLYIMIFLLSILYLDNYITELVLKVIIVLVGFSFYVWGQFNFTKKVVLSQQAVNVKKEELLVMKKRIDPHFVFLTLFIITIFARNVVDGIPFNILNSIIFVFAMLHLFVKYKKDVQ